jgi:hypothetical protein
MTHYARPYIPTPSDEELTNLYLVARLQSITFSKAEAAKWVGGRRALERLVREKAIRMNKSGERQNAAWTCNAEDVLRNAFRYYS